MNVSRFHGQEPSAEVDRVVHITGCVRDGRSLATQYANVFATRRVLRIYTSLQFRGSAHRSLDKAVDSRRRRRLAGTVLQILEVQGQEKRPSLLHREEATEQPYGDPQELVGALVWLASDGASFVTGITVLIDGGFSVHSGV